MKSANLFAGGPRVKFANAGGGVTAMMALMVGYSAFDECWIDNRNMLMVS